MENKIVEILIQGGLASVALVSVYFNFKIVVNHLSHSDDVMRELTKAIEGLRELISQHIKVRE